MAKKDNQRKSKLEETKKSLYDKYKKPKKKKRSKLHGHSSNVAKDWQESDSKEKTIKKPKKTSTMVRLAQGLLIVSVLFFIGAGIFAASNLMQNSNVVSTDSVAMKIVTKPFVDGGEEFDVTVRITNNNPTPLELADLIFKYPSSGGGQDDMQQERISLGTIESGETVFKDFSIQLYGTEGSTKKLASELEYRVKDSNAIFVKQASTEIGLRSTPIEVLVEGAEENPPGQPYSFDVVVQSNSSDDLSDILVELVYPNNFTFSDAEPSPVEDGKLWHLKEIPASESKRITINGSFEGTTGQSQVIRAKAGEGAPDDPEKLATVYTTQSHTISLTPAFIEAQLLVNGNAATSPVVSSTDGNDLDIDWHNTMPAPLEDVKVSMNFSGNAYSAGIVEGENTLTGETNRYFDSQAGVVRWTPSHREELSTVSPGEEHSFNVTFRPFSLVRSGGSPIVNPTISVRVDAEATLPGGEVKNVTGVANAEIAVNSNVQLTRRTLYYDGPFETTGPMPPETEERTEYTIGWQVTNTSNKLEEAELSTQLPEYVEWLGVVSPGSENVEFNEVNRELTWELGEVKAGAGFSEPAREVFIKLALTPSQTHKGKPLNLTDSLVLTGRDTYTGEILRIIKQNHTTRLLNDVSTEPGVVE